jgi:hypothetical protein
VTGLPLFVGAARIGATAIAIGIGAAMVWANAMSWGLEDWRTYLVAAERVASGGPVYEWTAGPEYVYRYAPWFAYALVPFLVLPRWAADLVWSGLVVAGTVAAVVPLVRHRTWAATALAFLGAGLLLRVASTGNVNPILIGALVLGLQTRAGPIVVAAAASLKATPLLFAAVYLAERRWTAAGFAVALTLVLVAPMTWLGYEITPGPSDSLFGISPIAWLLFAIGALAILAALTVLGSRHVALAAGAAAYLALPRSFLYDIALVLPGVRHRSPGPDR